MKLSEKHATALAITTLSISAINCIQVCGWMPTITMFIGVIVTNRYYNFIWKMKNPPKRDIIAAPINTRINICVFLICKCIKSEDLIDIYVFLGTNVPQNHSSERMNICVFLEYNNIKVEGKLTDKRFFLGCKNIKLNVWRKKLTNLMKGAIMNAKIDKTKDFQAVGYVDLITGEYVDLNTSEDVIYKPMEARGRDKAVAVVHNKIINGITRLKLDDFKVLFYFIAHINSINSENDNIVFQFNAVDVMKAVGLYGHKDQFKKALRNIHADQIIINKGTDEEKLLHWVDYLDIDLNDKIYLKFGTGIMSFLQFLKDNFTKVKFEDIFALSSKYSVRVFLLVEQFADTGFLMMSVESLRMILDPDNKYPEWRDFYKRILLASEKDINKNTSKNVKLTHNGQKGKKTTMVKAEVSDKKDALASKIDVTKKSQAKHTINNSGMVSEIIQERDAKTIPCVVKNDSVIIDELTEIFGAEATAKSLYETAKNKFSSTDICELIKDNIKYAKHKEKDGKIKENFEGYLREAIVNDYAKSVRKQERRILKEAQKAEADKKAKDEAARVAAEAEAINKQEEEFMGLPEEERNKWFAKAESQNKYIKGLSNDGKVKRGFAIQLYFDSKKNNV